MHSTTQLAASCLLKRKNTTEKFSRLAEDLRPNTTEEALAIQAEISKQHPSDIGGWKCLLPLDDERMVVAPIYSHTIYQGDSAKMYIDNNAARIEPEIAFILSQDLPARTTPYTTEEIDAAIGSTHIALELIQSRFKSDSQASFNEGLADGLSNQGLFIGAEIDKSLAYQASEINISLHQVSQQQEFAGKHPNPLPQQPIYWLINYMGQQGINFTAGQAIITGSYAGVVNVAFDEVLTIDYQGLGTTSLVIEQL